MQTLNFDIYFTVPISHKIIPLHIMYGQKIIFDYLVMPWETGISKQISFSEEFDDEDIQISQIKIINKSRKYG